MNWQHLNYFRAVAETQSFTQSAKDLYCTPSTLSKAISALEEELGFPLFVKSGRNSVLTENGRIFKKYVDKSLALIEEGITEIRAQTQGASGSFRVTGIYTVCLHYLPEKIKQFLEIYPNIQVTIHRNFSVDVLDMVINNKYDIGFCADFDTKDWRYYGIESRKIDEQEMVFVVSKEHPLADRGFITLDDIKDERFILSSNRNALNRTMFLDLCKEHDFQPNIAFEVPDDPTIISLLNSNLGISCMVAFPETRHPNLRILRFKEMKLSQSFYMIWNREAYLPPAAKLFRNYILENNTDDVEDKEKIEPEPS
ncbi:MAG: LysR family transcriptional regulator [Lachnospiraceae bacterium]|nr:LysR family transcriptional regulator [Lachnospiraceae bacterium]